jgi:hypothetical protein
MQRAVFIGFFILFPWGLLGSLAFGFSIKYSSFCNLQVSFLLYLL